MLRVLPPSFKPVNNRPDLLQNRFDVGVKRTTSNLPYLYTFEKRKKKLRQTHQQTSHPSEKYSHKNALLSTLRALCFVIIRIRSKETLNESYTQVALDVA